jgi:hypothetical protein
MGMACSTHGKKLNAYRVLVRRAEGKRPLGRSRHRLGTNITMNLRERGCGGTDWIHLAPDRKQWRILVKMVMNIRVP